MQQPLERTRAGRYVALRLLRLVRTAMAERQARPLRTSGWQWAVVKRRPAVARLASRARMAQPPGPARTEDWERRRAAAPTVRQPTELVRQVELPRALTRSLQEWPQLAALTRQLALAKLAVSAERVADRVSPVPDCSLAAEEQRMARVRLGLLDLAEPSGHSQQAGPAREPLERLSPGVSTQVADSASPARPMPPAEPAPRASPPRPPGAAPA